MIDQDKVSFLFIRQSNLFFASSLASKGYPEGGRHSLSPNFNESLLLLRLEDSECY